MRYEQWCDHNGLPQNEESEVGYIRWVNSLPVYNPKHEDKFPYSLVLIFVIVLSLFYSTCSVTFKVGDPEIYLPDNDPELHEDRPVSI